MRHSCTWLTAIVTAVVFLAPPAGAQDKTKKADGSEMKIKLPKPAFKGTPKHVPPDGPASLFGNANPGQPKHTSYVVTNIDGDDGRHWALEDTTTYPDGEYVVRIKAWNIAKSNGVGNAPNLNEVILDVIVSIETDDQRQVRLLTVRNP